MTVRLEQLLGSGGDVLAQLDSHDVANSAWISSFASTLHQPAAARTSSTVSGRVVFDDLGSGHAGCEGVEGDGDQDTGGADARLTVADR